MDRKTLIFLAVGIVVLMVIVAVAGLGGGLPRSTHALVNGSTRTVKQSQQQFGEHRQAVEKALAGDADLFTDGVDAVWKERLANAAKRFEEARVELGAARKALAENDKEKRVEIESAAQRAQNAARLSLAEAAEIRGTATERVRVKREFNDAVAKIETTHKSVQAADVSGLKALVAQAVLDWPGKKADLENRIARVEAHVARAQSAWQSAQAAGARADSKPEERQYAKVAAAAKTLREVDGHITNDSAKVRALTGQLYLSWDKILADMEIQESAVVTFHHKIKTVTTDTRGVTEEKPAKPVEKEAWTKVDKTRYLAMENNLGMVIAHKDAGKYDSEATKVAQAPGYAYVAPPGQRNRYGHWENRGGSSFWVFYGQYAFMRHMFWGSSWGGGIGTTHYHHYHDSYRSGRTWYGRDKSGKQMYGSKGSFASSSYSESKYKKSNGYATSRFKKSGGTYRGSKYASRSSSGRSGGYGSSRSSSSRSSSSRSRSSSSRSSRSFGGSRFGGGK